MAKDGLSRKVGYGMLAAFYAPLLTDRQQKLIQMYCDEDLSLSEIAGQLSVSRQAVSDNLNRAYERLDDLENHLKLYDSYMGMRGNIAACCSLLKKVKASPETSEYLQQAMKLLNEDSASRGQKDDI